MRLSELLTCPVLDADGVRVGRVHDVRLLDDGPSLANGQPGFRVEGLVVGGSGLGVRLGYERHGLTGPCCGGSFGEPSTATCGSTWTRWARGRANTSGCGCRGRS